MPGSICDKYSARFIPFKVRYFSEGFPWKHFMNAMLLCNVCLEINHFWLKGFQHIEDDDDQ